MKKLAIILSLFIIVVALSWGFNVHAHSMSVNKTEIINSGEAASGVSFESYRGTVINDAGTQSHQRISWVKKSVDAKAKIVAWSILEKTKIKGANMLNLARDFEEKNPGWRVLAGINGDYYDPPSKIPVNAFVQQGDVVRATNFTQPRYFSVGFTDDSSGFVSSKTNRLENKFSLSIYDDKKERIILEVPIHGFNIYPSTNQTSIYFSNQYPYQIAGAKYYRINDLDNIINIDSYLFKGRVSEVVDNTKAEEGQLVIVTLNEKVQSLLEQKPFVRVQKHLKDANNGLDNIIGVGSQPLKNGVVLEFSAINDQSLDFAKLRAPRSSFGFTKTGDFVMATIDGRQSLMAGVDLREEAMIMESLGCYQAFNLDGGGSSQLVVRKNNQLIMLNSPSEIYRNNANGLLLVEPDIYVDANITNLRLSGADLNYTLHPSKNIRVISHLLYLNDEALTENDGAVVIEGMVPGGINYLSMTVKYEKQGVIYERCLWMERINLANYGFVETVIKEKPHNFTVEFTKDESIKGFKAIINCEDPDKTLTKIYLAYDNKQEIAIKRATGYVVDFYNITESRTFTFSVVYYYRLDTINPVFESYEETFTYTYEVETDPIIDPDPKPQPEPNKRGCFSQNIVVSLTMLFFGLLILKRRFGRYD
ncbi:MAG TPA: phosphodiester glycosidase family protein [Bacilli bacterium]|nr:MAG: hypothetical protein BWY97_01202 [Tenericutes bacterium ADurb.BinA124]HNZ50231.1 phosphodiester glycosidase family protein [Bacilli bacterium]HPX83682.1 phosphodiester glycosidase family protein [Bacilli bacterium]HQC74510.1 phosphodiester glycosidase family protein [Bacilli bacterium]